MQIADVAGRKISAASEIIWRYWQKFFYRSRQLPRRQVRLCRMLSWGNMSSQSHNTHTITYMRTDDLDFELPSELIAQAPPPRREDSRLLHYKRTDRSIRHRKFSDLPELLRRGDLLVFNDARVLP